MGWVRDSGSQCITLRPAASAVPRLSDSWENASNHSLYSTAVLDLLAFVREFAFHVIPKMELLRIIWCSPIPIPHPQCHWTRWVHLSTKRLFGREEKIGSSVRDWLDANFLFLGSQEDYISQTSLLLVWGHLIGFWSRKACWKWYTPFSLLTIQHSERSSTLSIIAPLPTLS